MTVTIPKNNIAQLDSETSDHLLAWIRKTCLEDEWLKVADLVLGFLRDYPDLVNTRSWPEIRTLAERRAQG